jgi:hypothetical protein
VQASGYPLYWRPDDDHFLSSMELETPAGVIALTTTPTAALTSSSVALLKGQAAPNQKPPAAWTDRTFQEVAAIAVTKNAVLLTGLNRDAKNTQQIEAGLCALSLEDGKVLWKQSLPAAPVAWGLALDRTGRIVVTLTDGRVLGFDRE